MPMTHSKHLLPVSLGALLAIAAVALLLVNPVLAASSRY